MEVARKNNDKASEERLSNEKKELLSQWKADMGLGGRSSDLNTPINRMRSRIANALARAYKELREASPPMDRLAEHFEQSIHADVAEFVYRPPPPAPLWDFSAQLREK